LKVESEENAKQLSDVDLDQGELSVRRNLAASRGPVAR
jgi:hypothetical protein